MNINEKLYDVKLSFIELQLLDGNVNEKVQSIINEIKNQNLFGFDLPLANEIISNSLKKGTLSYRKKAIRHCSYCDKTYDYNTYTRNSTHHKKNDKNYNSPIYYSGWAFNEGFITLHGAGDICCDCATKYNLIDLLCEYVIVNKLPIELINRNSDSLFTKDPIKICYNCNEEIRESEMTREMAIMGGTYPSGCPYCHSKQLFMGSSHKSTDKFVMIERKGDK